MEWGDGGGGICELNIFFCQVSGEIVIVVLYRIFPLLCLFFLLLYAVTVLGYLMTFVPFLLGPKSKFWLQLFVVNSFYFLILTILHSSIHVSIIFFYPAIVARLVIYKIQKP